MVFMLILVIDDWCISCEIVMRLMWLDLPDDKSTLVKVMAWCCQATSHYLSQCWPRSMLPYSVTRPQWVKSLATGAFQWNFRRVNYKHILLIDGWCISCEIALRWISMDSNIVNFGSSNGLVRQTTSHYLIQCWPRYVMPGHNELTSKN